MLRSVMVAFSNPASPEQEEEFNRWYTENHIKDVVGSVPGIVKATRYKLNKDVGSTTGAPTHSASYLAIYEIEGNTTEDLKAIAAAIGAAVKAGKVDISPALDLTTLQTSYAIPICETSK
jgi:hypothetical protein